MNKLEETTQALFLRLDKTSQSRSTKADLLFRRLRLDRDDQIADEFMRAPETIAIVEEEKRSQSKNAKRTKRAR